MNCSYYLLFLMTIACGLLFLKNCSFCNSNLNKAAIIKLGQDGDCQQRDSQQIMRMTEIIYICTFFLSSPTIIEISTPHLNTCKIYTDAVEHHTKTLVVVVPILVVITNKNYVRPVDVRYYIKCLFIQDCIYACSYLLKYCILSNFKIAFYIF